MLQTTFSALIVRHATLSFRHRDVAMTLKRLSAHTPLINARRTFISSGTRKVSLTDPSSHKQATGAHYRPFALALTSVSSHKDSRG